MSSEPDIRPDLSVKAEIDLYYDLYEPANITRPVPLLIAVHGYGAHKRYMIAKRESSLHQISLSRLSRLRISISGERKKAFASDSDG